MMVGASIAILEAFSPPGSFMLLWREWVGIDSVRVTAVLVILSLLKMRRIPAALAAGMGAVDGEVEVSGLCLCSGHHR